MIRLIVVVSSVPVLISPKNSSDFLEGDSITFKWMSACNADSYALQIDTTRYFNSSDLIEIEGINGTEYTLNEGLTFGNWYWRVYVIFKDGQIAFSEIRIIGILSFDIPKVEPNPFLVYLFYYSAIIILGVTFLYAYWKLNRLSKKKNK